MKKVFRVLGKSDWALSHDAGIVPPCGSDSRDGFIHLSRFEDIIDTANLYFDLSESPLVLEVDAEALGDKLRWEKVASRGGRSFPHLYAPGIPLKAVRATHPLTHDGTSFHLGTRCEIRDT